MFHVFQKDKFCIMITLKKIECDICKKKYYFKAKLRLHVHTNTHAGIKPYSCSTCGNKFSTGYNLLAHLREVHGGEGRKKCLCTLCEWGSHEKENYLNITKTLMVLKKDLDPPKSLRYLNYSLFLYLFSIKTFFNTEKKTY